MTVLLFVLGVLVFVVGLLGSVALHEAGHLIPGKLFDVKVTQFFVGKTRAPLTERFLPIVTTATARVQLADKYNAIAAKASGLGLMKSEDANVQRYVTGKSLDGLYLVIGDEERKIRQDPVGSGSAILQKVFGALR